MLIIGITGTIGSGKGTVVDYLVNKYGFTHYSVRAFLSEEVARRGMPDTRDSMHIVGNSLRTEFGPASTANTLYERALQNGGNAVIESLRNIEEIKSLQAKPQPCLVLAVDADQKVRYDRVMLRKSSTDHVSFEKFQTDEAREMVDADPNGMNIAQCMQMADAHLNNDGDIEALHAAIDKIVQPLL
ncbi:MAG TPA: AAA family ATPase [Patescibacteria group bacterium]|jgi:hypothetical protein|nr:AAA family ATPase [Patescibacteria group bacterium]